MKVLKKELSPEDIAVEAGRPSGALGRYTSPWPAVLCASSPFAAPPVVDCGAMTELAGGMEPGRWSSGEPIEYGIVPASAMWMPSARAPLSCRITIVEMMTVFGAKVLGAKRSTSAPTP